MSIAVWIVIGLVILVACAGSSGKGGQRSGSRGGPTRIDHPHYNDKLLDFLNKFERDEMAGDRCDPS